MYINDQEAGIYLHIPFCRKACHYCNFHFSTSLQSKEAYLLAMHSEIDARVGYTEGKIIRSIYFGGGTPSVLTADEISSLLAHIKQLHTVRADAEVTLEANPDDLSKPYIESIHAAGINRLSIGVQSFIDHDLQWMNRTHTGSQAKQVITDAMLSGFEHMSADLIYGIPGSSHEEWRSNIQTLIDLKVPHISSYALTVEPKTALAHFIQTGKSEMPDEQLAAEQFEILRHMLIDAGYDHYEISNFALPGHTAIHNSAYWAGYYYLGIGAAAHSYNGVSRQWNINNNALYIRYDKSGNEYYTIENLDMHQRMNERIMTALRTTRGLDLERFLSEFGEVYHNQLTNEIRRLESAEKMIIENNIARISPSHLFIADSVISDLFFVD
ncbi:MAG TPA: radical SAM family heme chaperone HemW [Chitinophagales bacterium]|nr:radical SAM family heme chaperone HemW [Chitinophagales bacterium]HMX04014.1 radical SAM family heme chaperone HemW [Chitinophagales bacterium]HNF69425.1 radical SAM family heme chaperone HemW [Chitinophagales bacterium]HNI53943.1 radical SAM family heme chaperone HemW [Chitinophagales bacterium]HNJ87844.1 radical SAM family heme chaperone HemW [Chitinophagales bacterium]